MRKRVCPACSQRIPKHVDACGNCGADLHAPGPQSETSTPGMPAPSGQTPKKRESLFQRLGLARTLNDRNRWTGGKVDRAQDFNEQALNKHYESRAAGWVWLTIGIVGVGAGALGWQLLGPGFTTFHRNHDPATAGIAAGVLFASMLIVCYGVLRVHWANREIRPSAAEEGAQVGEFVAHVPLTRECEGLEYEEFYSAPIPGKKNSPDQPSCLRIRVRAGVPVSLLLNSENWYDRLSKRMGIARELRTGDAEFDARVYVRTSATHYAASFFETARRREAVLSLLGMGFQSVAFEGGLVTVSWTGFNPETSDRGLAAVTVGHLRALTTDLPAAADFPLPTFDHGRSMQLMLLVIGGLFAATITLNPKYPPIQKADAIFAGLMLSLALLPAFGWLAAMLLRGRSNSHDQWRVVMLWALGMIPAGCIGSVVGLNGALDHRQPAIRTATIFHKEISRGKKGETYRTFTLKDLAVESLSASSEEFDAVVPGKSKVELTIGQGRLGIPWLRSHRVLP